MKICEFCNATIVGGNVSALKRRRFCRLECWYAYVRATTPVIICDADGCYRSAVTRRLCEMHYARVRRAERGPRMFGRPCGVDGCERFSMKKGLCDTHYRRWRLHGDVMADLPIRKVDGSGSVDSLGYRRLYRPDHPNADRTGCVHEHTVVMSEVLGRSLIKGENVHHKNGNRADNRPENLELWLVRQPKGQRVEDLLQYARWVLETYS